MEFKIVKGEYHDGSKMRRGEMVSAVGDPRTAEDKYYHNDLNGNRLIDPAETVCRVELRSGQEPKDTRLGKADGALGRMIAGFSRSSAIVPGDTDSVFPVFVGRLAPALYTKYQGRIVAAYVSHKANAARDLGAYVRVGVIEDVLRADQASVYVNRADQAETNTKLRRAIEACFELAKADGVTDQAPYRATLVASLRIVKARLLDQQTLDGQDRAVFLGFLDDLIVRYQAPEGPVPAAAPAPG